MKGYTSQSKFEKNYIRIEGQCFRGTFSDVYIYQQKEGSSKVAVKMTNAKWQLANCDNIPRVCATNVYDFQQINGSETVALKKGEPSLEIATSGGRIFGDMLKVLRSDHIVEVCGWFPTDTKGTMGLILEYCGIGDLKKYAEKNSPLSDEMISDVALQVVKGLHFLHEQNFLHRNVRLENVLLKAVSGKIIAKLGLPKAEASFTEDVRYCPPELKLANEQYSEKCDIWAFGVLVADMMGLSVKQLLHQDSQRSQLSQFVLRVLVEDVISRPSSGEILSDPFFNNNPLYDEEVKGILLGMQNGIKVHLSRRLGKAHDHCGARVLTKFPLMTLDTTGQPGSVPECRSFELLGDFPICPELFWRYETKSFKKLMELITNSEMQVVVVSSVASGLCKASLVSEIFYRDDLTAKLAELGFTGGYWWDLNGCKESYFRSNRFVSELVENTSPLNNESNSRRRLNILVLDGFPESMIEYLLETCNTHKYPLKAIIISRRQARDEIAASNKLVSFWNLERLTPDDYKVLIPKLFPNNSAVHSIVKKLSCGLPYLAFMMRNLSRNDLTLILDNLLKNGKWDAVKVLSRIVTLKKLKHLICAILPYRPYEEMTFSILSMFGKFDCENTSQFIDKVKQLNLRLSTNNRFFGCHLLFQSTWDCFNYGNVKDDPKASETKMMFMWLSKSAAAGVLKPPESSIVELLKKVFRTRFLNAAALSKGADLAGISELFKLTGRIGGFHLAWSLFEILLENEHRNVALELIRCDWVTLLDDAVCRALEANIEELSDLLIKEKGFDVNGTDAVTLDTFLVGAVKSGREKLVEVLISYKCNVNRPETSSGKTPLLLAVEMGSEVMVRLLIDANADQLAEDKQGLSILESAVSAERSRPSPGMVIMLLQSRKHCVAAMLQNFKSLAIADETIIGRMIVAHIGMKKDMSDDVKINIFKLALRHFINKQNSNSGEVDRSIVVLLNGFKWIWPSSTVPLFEDIFQCAIFLAAEIGKSNVISYLISSEKARLSDSNHKGETVLTMLLRLSVIPENEDNLVNLIAGKQMDDILAVENQPGGQQPVDLACQRGFYKLVAAMLNRNIKGTYVIKTEKRVSVLTDMLENVPPLFEKVVRLLDPQNARIALDCVLKLDRASTLSMLSLFRAVSARNMVLDSLRMGIPDIMLRLWKSNLPFNLHSTETGNSILMIAVEQRYPLVAVIFLLENKCCEIDEQNYAGETAMHIAAKANLINVVELLLDRRASTTIKDNIGRTALCLAVENGHFEMVKLFLRSRSLDTESINIAFRDPDTNFLKSPIWLAFFEKRNFEMVKIFKEMGAVIDRAQFVEETLSRHSKLITATSTPAEVTGEQFQDKHEVKHFVADLKEDLNVHCEETGETMLTSAIQLGDQRLVKCILENGGKIGLETRNREGKNAAVLAVQMGSLKMLELLIEAGADVNTFEHRAREEASFEKNVSLLAIAVENGFVDIVNFLTKTEGVEAKFTSGNRDILLTEAIHFKRPDLVQVVLLTMSNEDIENLVDCDGNNVLAMAVSAISVEVVNVVIQDFIRRGIRFNVPNKKGQTPLAKAITTIQLPIAQEILSKISDEDLLRHCDDEGNNTLASAVISGSAELVAVAVNEYTRRSVSFNVTNKNGLSPLVMAIKRNADANMVNAIIERLSTEEIIEQADMEGNNAIALAVLEDNVQVAYVIILECNKRGIGQDMFTHRNGEGASAFFLALQGQSQAILIHLLQICKESKEKSLVEQLVNSHSSAVGQHKEMSAFAFAVSSGNYEVTKLLFDNGASIDESEWPEGCAAGKLNHLAKMLIKYAKDSYINSPLGDKGNAINNGSIQHKLSSVIRLVGESADIALLAMILALVERTILPVEEIYPLVNFAVKIGNNSDRQHLIETLKSLPHIRHSYSEHLLMNGDSAVLTLLQQNGFLFFGDPPDQQFLLLHAINNQYPMPSLAFIIDYKLVSSIDEKNKTGETALHLAAKNNLYDVVDLLLSKGASSEEIDDSGRTALYLAVERNHVESVEKFRRLLGANANSLNIDHKTSYAVDVKPLLWLAFFEKRNCRISRWLIEMGARIDDAFVAELFQPSKKKAQIITSNYKAKHILEVYLDELRIDINRKSYSSGDTVLMRAIKVNPADITEVLNNLLKRSNIDLSVINKEGQTALHLAVELNSTVAVMAILRKLVRSGSECLIQCLTQANRDGKSVLFVAQNSLEILELILSVCKDAGVLKQVIEHRDASSGDSLLLTAVNGKKCDIVRLLINFGAEVNAVNSEGYSALSEAVRANDNDIVDILLKKETMVGDALLVAVAKGDRQMTSKLLAAQESQEQLEMALSSRNIFDDNVLAIGARRNDTEMVKLLLEKTNNASVLLASPNCAGLTALTIACLNLDLNLIQQLLAVDKAYLSSRGSSVLFNVVQHFAAELDFCEEVVTSAKPRWPPTDDAVKVINLLLKNGASPYETDDLGNNVLILASASCNFGNNANGNYPLKIARCLLASNQITNVKSYVNTANAIGTTPLMAAAFRGNLELCQCLELHGANYEIEDNNGNNCLAFARANDKTNVVDYFSTVGDADDDIDD